MPICPECGEEVALGERSCGACGAEVPATRRRRFYLVSAAALAAIIVAAALLHSFLETRIVRSPTEFLPVSTRAVIDLDLRPDSPAMDRIESAWQESDAEVLAGRAVQLAQRGVDWTGLQLDLSEEAGKWFGGEVLVASVAPSHLRALTPRSIVVIARATDLRRARRDLDQSVAEMAREAGWDRSAVRTEGHTIVIWGHADGRSQVAYAALDGCVILSANEDVVELCIQSAEDSTPSLAANTGFVESTRSLPADAFLWCYASAPDLVHTVRSVLPEIGHGWLGIARAFMRHSAAPSAETGPDGSTASGGSVALAVTPESDGVRLHANYWAGKEVSPSTSSPHSTQLLDLVPGDAVAFAVLRGLPRLVSPLVGDSGPPSGGRDVFVPFIFRYPMSFLLDDGSIPEAVLITILPSKSDERDFVAAAAFAGLDTDETIGRIQKFVPQIATATINEAQVFAANAEALDRIRAAAEDEAARLETRALPDVRLQAWGRPGELWPRLERFGDVGFQVRDKATGAQMELSVKAEPRYLLGGD